MTKEPNDSESIAQRALAAVVLPKYSGIASVFGTVLKVRSESPNPNCSWFQMLVDGARILEEVNADCKQYAALLGENVARKKCEDELLGPARRSSQKTFQHILEDFYAEVAAVIELGKRCGYTSFCAIPRKKDAKSHDYEAITNGNRVCIEVKHMRAPRTAQEVVFDEVEGIRNSSLVTAYPFTLRVVTDNDNTVSEDREDRIKKFVQELVGKVAPFEETLIFSDGSKLAVFGIPGEFRAFASRNITLGDPERISVAGFLNKIREKAEDAFNQLKDQDCQKVLVININTSWAEVSADHLRLALSIAREASGGILETHLLLHYHFVDLDAA